MRSLKDIVQKAANIDPVQVNIVIDVIERAIVKLRRKAYSEGDAERKGRIFGILDGLEKALMRIREKNYPKARYEFLGDPLGYRDVRDFIYTLSPSMDTKLALDDVLFFNAMKFRPIPKKVSIMESKTITERSREIPYSERVKQGIVAWTGGSRPPKVLPPEAQELAKRLYADQLQVWHDYWGDWPDKDTKNIFKIRARGDAWATYREKHGDELGENAVGGAVGAGSVAAVPGGLFSRSKMLRRKTKIGKIPVIRYHNESIMEINLKESLMNQLLEFQAKPKFNPADVQSKLDSAEKRLDFQRNSVPFGLKDENGQIVVVYVRPDQADDFENVVASELNQVDSTPSEIAELLFNLRGRFDIIHAEWPAVPEDQEEPAGAAAAGAAPAPGGEGGLPDLGGEGGEGGLPDLGAEGEGGEGGLPDMGAAAPPEGDAAASALDKVIDMLKADVEARKAEAEAEKAKANAEEAKYASQIANSKVRSEQEMLDAEAYYKGQKNQQQEAKRLALLARYRNDVAQNVENEVTGAI